MTAIVSNMCKANFKGLGLKKNRNNKKHPCINIYCISFWVWERKGKERKGNN